VVVVVVIVIVVVIVVVVVVVVVVVAVAVVVVVVAAVVLTRTIKNTKVKMEHATNKTKTCNNNKTTIPCIHEVQEQKPIILVKLVS
jgi:mannitol-specific phosphotransferase system IIBC component